MQTYEVTEHCWIPLPDGTRLAARMWLPAGAAAVPVPAILEYIPYRKRDGTRARDEPMHGYFAAHGYAALRVDMRGSGESDGLMEDEYLRQEQEDACAVIAWIADQPWCTGHVGMMGKSWGGFNALQVAACRPPALKAVVSAYSTDDRFRDDIHFMGGCVLNDNLWWGSIMLAYQSRPPDPALRDDWRAVWLDRIAAMKLFPALWLAHQHYDVYWKHGSIAEDFAAITCPVLAVGGWADSYTNAVPRLLEGLGDRCRAIIGPWGHIYPQDGVPGPAIGFLQELVRWWDRWLKDAPGDEPPLPALRAWVNGPRSWTGEEDGRWVELQNWPSPLVSMRSFALGPGNTLKEGPAAPHDAPERLTVCSPCSHGRAAGEWMATGCPGEMPADQRLDDGDALVFQTHILTKSLSILGAPRLRLRLSSDRASGQIAVRMSDVAPDGRATRVSYQVLNLSHRHSHAAPEPMTTGRFEDVTVTLGACGHVFAPGHRLRLSVATGYWPTVWPAPERATLTLEMPGCALDLPVLAEDAPAASFDPPEHGRPTPVTQVDPGMVRRISTQDHVTGERTYVTEGVGGLFGEGVLRFDEIGTEISHDLTRTLVIRDDDPLSARATIDQRYAMGRPGWEIEIRSHLTMRGDPGHFHITGWLEASENGTIQARREWNERIAREPGT